MLVPPLPVPPLADFPPLPLVVPPDVEEPPVPLDWPAVVLPPLDERPPLVDCPPLVVTPPLPMSPPVEVPPPVPACGEPPKVAEPPLLVVPPLPTVAPPLPVSPPLATVPPVAIGVPPLATVPPEVGNAEPPLPCAPPVLGPVLGFSPLQAANTGSVKTENAFRVESLNRRVFMVGSGRDTFALRRRALPEAMHEANLPTTFPNLFAVEARIAVRSQRPFLPAIANSAKSGRPDSESGLPVSVAGRSGEMRDARASRARARRRRRTTPANLRGQPSPPYGVLRLCSHTTARKGRAALLPKQLRSWQRG